MYASSHLGYSVARQRHECSQTMVSTHAAAQSSSESGMTKTTAGMSVASASSAEHHVAEHAGDADTSDLPANPQHLQHHQSQDDDEHATEAEGKNSYTLTTIPGRSSGNKTVWSTPAHHNSNNSSKSSTRTPPADADAADLSARSLRSGRSLGPARSSRSFGVDAGGGGSKSGSNGGRAASMLARTRLTATTSAGSASASASMASMRSAGNSTASAGSAIGRRRARSFDDDHNIEMDVDGDALPSSSAEYFTEYSTSLNDVDDDDDDDYDDNNNNNVGGQGSAGRLMDSVKLDGAQEEGEGEGEGEDVAEQTDNANSNSNSNSGLNEADKARMALWGVAARNANATTTSGQDKQPHQAGQGTSESRDRDHQPQHQPHQQQQQVDTSRFYVSSPPQQAFPEEQHQRADEYRPQINQLAVLFSQAQSLGQKAYDKGQQSYRNLRQGYNMYGCDVSNDDDEEEGGGRGGGPTTNHPEITGGFHGQDHASFFDSATASNAKSYMSDMCSLLIVLVQAPFLWLYFVITGRDYHDRYGNVNLQQTAEGIYGGVDASTSQGTFASRTSRMSAEEKQERSEVYLEAKDEDGTLFAMLAFHHPGLAPLVDETVDNVALVHELGEDTAKTGHTDLATALNPDGCGMLQDSSDGDDSSGTGDFDARSVGSAGVSEAFGGGVDASRSGRSRNSRSSRSRSRHRSKSRARSSSVDARVRRNRDDDEWEYDITTQKMKRKRKKRGGRRRDKSVSRRGSIGSAASFDARSFGGGLGLEDELMSTRSGDLTTASAHSEPPQVIGGASTSGSSWGGGVRRGRRRGSTHSSDRASRRRSSSEEGQRAIAKFKAAIEQKGGIKSVADEWEARGKTSDMDRAAWKSSSDMDDLMAITMNELADIGDVPSPYVQPASQRPDGRKGLGMNSFRKVQDTLRKSTRSMSSHDGAQVNHDEDVVRPITDIV